jgi:hypothetical protein
MKHRYLLMILCLALLSTWSISTKAQLFGNEWINYGQDYFRIPIAEDGIYRLDSADLAEMLNSAGEDPGSFDPRQFQVFHEGSEEPIYIFGESDASLDDGDFLEFLGFKNRGSFDSLLYASGSLMLHQEFSLVNDTASYYLTWNSSTSNLRADFRTNDLSGVPAPENYIDWTTHEVLGDSYGSFVGGPSTSDVFSSQYENGEGFAGSAFNLTTVSYTLNTPDRYIPLESENEFRLTLIGWAGVAHRSEIRVNGLLYEDDSYVGYQRRNYKHTLSNIADANTVEVTAAGFDVTDYQQVSIIEIDYKREPDLGSASEAQFNIASSPSSSRYLELSDFNASEGILYDLDAQVRMISIASGDSLRYHLDYFTEGNSIHIESSINNLSSGDWEAAEFIDFTNPAEQGDYLIISHPHFFDDGSGVNWVQEYADYRASFGGGEYDVSVVEIDQLYDQFAYGIRKHPLAVRNYLRYSQSEFDQEARYAFIIGKGRHYKDFRGSSAQYDACYIPTFGHPGSDQLLASERGDFVPQIAIGRLAAQNPSDIEIYFDKVVEFEANQQSMLQSTEEKLWMKNILHFGGGISSFEQNTFRGYLEDYAETIEDTLYGAKVTSFYKTSTDPIITPESDRIDSLLQAGVSLMTFFGHSSINSFDYNIGVPEEFPTAGKYPIVFGNGCVTGEIHQSTVSLSEDYIFAENAGSIGFIAASTLSFASGLNMLASEFYRQLSYVNYEEGIGECMRASIEELAPTVTTIPRLAIEHTTVHGDPALNLNAHTAPDYILESSSLSLDPPIVTVAQDSFDLIIDMPNLGRALDSAYFIQVRRFYPDGREETIAERVSSPYYRDTAVIRIATEGSDAVGLNRLEVTLDVLDEITEIDELNNVRNIEFLLASDDAVPVYPYDFSIQANPPSVLSASTASVFAEERQYLIQIDTTRNFNSPLFQENRILQSGGVVRWENPTIPWTDSTVYYWRISLDSIYDNDLLWRDHSFVYIDEYESGWNQSHYDQFLQDSYVNMRLDDDRVFKYVNDNRVVDIFTGGAWFEILSFVDNAQIALSACPWYGFVTMVFDPESGFAWETYRADGSTGIYGDFYCSSKPTQQIIQFHTNTPEWREAMYNFMVDSIPDNHYFIAYSTLFALDYSTWLDDSIGPDNETLLDAFGLYGATDIYSFDTLSYNPDFIFFGQKGHPEKAEEIFSSFDGEKIEGTFNIPGFWREGIVTSTLIGPAADWTSVEWSSENIDPSAGDIQSLDIIGIDINGNQEVLREGLVSGDTSLAFVDPATHPYIRLRLDTEDDSLRTPTQLLNWRVLYDPVPEAALNPAAEFSFFNDTLLQGQDLTMDIAIDNVSLYDMDSLLISYRVVDENNQSTDINYPRQAPLLAEDRFISELTINTFELPLGNNLLYIDVNPDDDQPEQSHFNNIAVIPFRLEGDLINPYLDVTFDGIRILDGDIVSAEPEILIRLSDESDFLALNDTALVEMSIIDPSGNTRRVYFNDPKVRFTPADETNLSQKNEAEILIEGDFEEDGVYILVVHGEDVSGNDAGDIDYRVSFEVINEAMISNVFNYPNPFSTRTHFVFTLTGSEVPQYFKIQIMTVSGKIVREIQAAELGPLHVGHNKTTFAWDGTDQYGDRLANGLYLYRVVTRLNGEEIKAFETGTDQFFKNGWGKMYIAR